MIIKQTLRHFDRALAERSRKAAHAFVATVEEKLGGSVIEPYWKGNKEPHECICPKGHPCRPRPNAVQQGRGMCQTCGQQASQKYGRKHSLRSIAKWTAFKEAIAADGGTVEEPAYKGYKEPHQCTCPNGHVCKPSPDNIARGQGMCWKCADAVRGRSRKDSAWIAFKGAIESLGAELLDTQYKGSDVTHLVRCAKGHLCRPRPASVASGRGICADCHVHADAFYITVKRTEHRVKFGVTSGEPRARLRDQLRVGYTEVVCLHIGLAAGVAHQIEFQCRLALAEEMFDPTEGWEYFSLDALATVLKVAESYHFKDETSAYPTGIRRRKAVRA